MERRRDRLVLPLAAVMAVVFAACSSPAHQSAPASTASSSTSSQTVASTSVTSPSTTSPSPPPTRGPTTITRNNLTLHAPSGWVAEGRLNYFGFGPVPRPPGTALIALEALFGFSDTIDSLKPGACEAQPGVNAPTPISVTLVDSGFRPVGDRTAEYRNWALVCPSGLVEGHRAWLLPQSKIALYERCRMDGVSDAVATAEVSDGTAQSTSTTLRPPRPESPFSCKG